MSIKVKDAELTRRATLLIKREGYTIILFAESSVSTLNEAPRVVGYTDRSKDSLSYQTYASRNLDELFVEDYFKDEVAQLKAACRIDPTEVYKLVLDHLEQRVEKGKAQLVGLSETSNGDTYQEHCRQSGSIQIHNYAAYLLQDRPTSIALEALQKCLDALWEPRTEKEDMPRLMVRRWKAFGEEAALENSIELIRIVRDAGVPTPVELEWLASEDLTNELSLAQD